MRGSRFWTNRTARAPLVVGLAENPPKVLPLEPPLELEQKLSAWNAADSFTRDRLWPLAPRFDLRAFLREPTFGHTEGRIFAIKTDEAPMRRPNRISAYQQALHQHRLLEEPTLGEGALQKSHTPEHPEQKLSPWERMERVYGRARNQEEFFRMVNSVLPGIINSLPGSVRNRRL